MFKSVDTAGTLLGERYRLIRLAGQGGMAEVWRADLEGSAGFRRPVAVKRILPHLVDSEDHRAMFTAEAQLTALLDHPNIVQVHDFGEDPSGLFIVMEWVEGLTLKDLAGLFQALGVLPSPALAAAVGIEMLHGLAAAHENFTLEPDGTTRPKPIIHRDVSPSNVLLSVRGVVKLADFGLARLLHRLGLSGLTPAGIVKGKLPYLAPEIVQGESVTPLADIYSAGVVLWELVCGGRLWGARGDPEIAAALVKGEPAPPVQSRRHDAPPALAYAIDRALAPDPARRHASATEFARALSDVLRTIPERTDAARMSREVIAAIGAWRDLQKLAAARDGAAAPPIERVDAAALKSEIAAPPVPPTMRPPPPLPSSSSPRTSVRPPGTPAPASRPSTPSNRSSVPNSRPSVPTNRPTLPSTRPGPPSNRPPRRK